MGGTTSKVDYKISAVILGLRYKIQTSSSWKPYLSFGVSSAKTAFTLASSNTATFASPKSGSTIGAQIGLGVDLGISESWSINIGALIYTNVQLYQGDYTSQGYKTMDRGFNELNLGLRYHF